MRREVMSRGMPRTAPIRLLAIVAAVVGLALGGCGRKGPLDPPPASPQSAFQASG